MYINWLLFAFVVFAFIFKINNLEERINKLEQGYPNEEELRRMHLKEGTD